MSKKLNYLLAVLILMIGIGGQLTYDLYLKPYVLTEQVVKIKVSGDYMPRNVKLQEKDLYLDNIPVEHIPDGAITNLQDAVNKILKADITNGTILTKTLVDIENKEPLDNEGIFPIPRDVIFAINGSLRNGDYVDILLVHASGNAFSDLINKRYLENVPVSYVRTDDNNDVMDTEEGNINERMTSTGRVSSIEVKLDKRIGEDLTRRIEQGYKLWIVRVK